MESKTIKPLRLEDFVNPEFKEALKHFHEINVPSTLEELSEVRKGYNAFFSSLQKPNENVTITIKNVQGPETTPDVPVRVYKLKNRDENKKRPAILFIHGGAMIFGKAEFIDDWCSRLVEEIDCVAFSVDYRLAPEDPYPCGLEDCYTSLLWISKSAEELGIDPKKIAIGGFSCGGGLAISLAMLARDRKGPEICFLAPFYPMIDDRSDTQSVKEIADKRVWHGEASVTSWKWYLGNIPKDSVPAYAAPARATDLTNLPSTFLCVGQLDPYRDDTVDFASRLMKARVPCELHVYAGCFHGIEVYDKNAEISRLINDTAIAALKRALKD